MVQGLSRDKGKNSTSNFPFKSSFQLCASLQQHPIELVFHSSVFPILIYVFLNISHNLFETFQCYKFFQLECTMYKKLQNMKDQTKNGSSLECQLVHNLLASDQNKGTKSCKDLLDVNLPITFNNFDQNKNIACLYLFANLLFEFGFEFDVLRLTINLFPLLNILIYFESSCIWFTIVNSCVNMKPTIDINLLL